MYGADNFFHVGDRVHTKFFGNACRFREPDLLCSVAGKVVFLAGGQSAEAIDVSDPDKPIKLASQRFPDELANASPRYQGGGDSAHDLVYRDGYLYVTGQNDHRLLILQVDSDRIRELAGQRN